MSTHPSLPMAGTEAARAVINRQNAARSTGPVTKEGKARAALNAIRHGLTGQTVVLPEDDLAAYRASCAQFFDELKPEGLLESRAVQTIADTHWRLDRIRAMENNLFSLGFQEHSRDFASDPAIDCALAQAKSLDSRADLLVRISLYEQRLNRTLARAYAELKQLQQERAQERKQALEHAGQIRKPKEALNQSRQPEQSAQPARGVVRDTGNDGFEFSSAHLASSATRRDPPKRPATSTITMASPPQPPPEAGSELALAVFEII
jgi:hypothetical protein